MNIDEAIHEAFDLEARSVPVRRPSGTEIARACDRPSSRRKLVIGFGWDGLLPLVAMAAAVFVFVSLEPAQMLKFRPLARELVLNIPEGAGSRFLDFILEAGESYRSMD
jgi:hypothetical protein